MKELIQLLMFGCLVLLAFGTTFTLTAYGWRKALAWFSFWTIVYVILIVIHLGL